MKDDLKKKIDEMKELIRKNEIYQEAAEIRERLLKDEVTLKQIKQLQEEDRYSSSYLENKEKLYQNQDYKRYQELENELYFMTLEISRILDQLIGKKDCQK